MIEYRDATPADGPELDALAQEVWKDTFARFYTPEDLNAYLTKAYGPNGDLIRDLADPAVRFHLATAEGKIVGYVKVSPPWLPDAEAGAMQLGQLYLDYGWHGSGIARHLMDWAEARGREAGATSLLLTVWEENHRAHAFYVKRGFEHIGDYAFPVGEKIDRDLIMRLAL
jgi:ribosomal protein S18 acetylase RimI-like enzyme